MRANQNSTEASIVTKQETHNRQPASTLAPEQNSFAPPLNPITAPPSLLSRSTIKSLGQQIGNQQVQRLVAQQTDKLSAGISRSADLQRAPQQQNTPQPAGQQTAQPKKVYVIGSPAQAEIDAKHPYQFVNAAKYQGIDSNTVWIVERTGYELGKVPLGEIEKQILSAKGQLIWLTPENSLVEILSSFGPASISHFTVFSHGLPGELTLRYGWKGHKNYGLSAADVSGLRGSVFKQDAEIAFHSCNTGSQGENGSLAQDVASQIRRPVKAWTGRTSYRDINNGMQDGSAQVGPSRIWSGGRQPDYTEIYSQYMRGRVPKLQTFKPNPGFTSTFEIKASLETRTFEVPEGGSVKVTAQGDYSSLSFYTPKKAYYIKLSQSRSGFDSNNGTKTFRTGARGSATWDNLKGGIYYLVLSKDNPHGLGGYEEIKGTITVDVS